MLNQPSFDIVLNLYNSYSDDQKVELIKLLYLLLPKERKKMANDFLRDKQLEVNFGKCEINATNVYQVNLQNPDQVADVLSAIALHIRSEKSD